MAVGTEIELLDRQVRILRFIAQYVSVNRIAPSVREIGAECAISSTSVVKHHLVRLVELGLLERRPLVARAMWLTPAAHRWLQSQAK